MPLPLILAGPILRRVEPTLVTVWLALREACTVEIRIWDGLVKDESSAKFFSDPTNPEIKGFLANTANTIRVGEQLHIATTTFKLPPEKALRPDTLYSYNVTLNSFSETHDLKSLGLLKTGDIEGKPNLSLGYAPGSLPSFALPPMELTNLRILHGSCRKTNRNVPDGLAWVDDFIEEALLNPQARPHQLMLTGDQIYADDVDEPFLFMLIEAAKKLIGSEVDASEERIPLERLPAVGKLWPADETHFPPGYRFSLTINHAKLTSVDGHSHLLSLGDFCAMYLFVWSNACWPDKLPTEEEITKQLFSFGWLGLMPADLRTQILGEKEKETLISFYRLGELSGPVLQNILGSAVKLPQTFDDKNKKDEKEKKEKLKDLAAGASKKLLLFKQLWQALPKVRRALANVPTYMMFDDHEITDDWYLNPMWRDRVLDTPLGRTMIRNGLVAYALFQGWGNDPVKFETGDNQRLLDEATKLLRPGEIGPDETAGNEIDKLLGLDLRDTKKAPPVKWHYSVKCAKHLLVALDNRTRRSFVSRIGPPGNLSLEAIEEQIPAGPLPAGLEVLILVAPLPVIGPPVLDELVAPLVYRVFDVASRNKLDKRAGSKGMAGTNPDAIEAWAFDPTAFEGLLKRLEPYRRVVILSGDVHNASSQAMSYWKKGDTEPARFAQFTSSGFKNIMPWYIRFVDRSFATAQRIVRANIGTERLGWNVRAPTPLEFPENVEIASALRSRLRHEPILIPGEGWPKDTKKNRLPDFQWRVDVKRDERSDDLRPLPAQVEPLDPTKPNADVIPNLDGHRRIVVRHAKQLTQILNSRQILFANNLGRVRFVNENQTLVALHEIFTAFPFVGAETLEKPALFTLHRVAMSNPTEKKPEEKFTNA